MVGVGRPLLPEILDQLHLLQLFRLTRVYYLLIIVHVHYTISVSHILSSVNTHMT